RGSPSIPSPNLMTAAHPSRFGTYRVESVLGEGGMGTVYLARDAAGREVALKVVLDEWAGDPEVERRFAREAKLARSIVHPNVVRTFEAGRVEGKLYLACEVVPGGSLAGLLEREGRLPEPRALALVRDLLAALEAVQRAGLIHRDVKPANILLAGP